MVSQQWATSGDLMDMFIQVPEPRSEQPHRVVLPMPMVIRARANEEEKTC
jgi:hypothetical protein